MGTIKITYSPKQGHRLTVERQLLREAYRAKVCLSSCHKNC